MKTTVVGRGVIGLTTAVELLARGHEVVVAGERAALDTTSAVAAALWYPYRAMPRDKVTMWGAISLERFRRLSAETGTGVLMRHGIEIGPDEDIPWWSQDVLPVERWSGRLPQWAACAWEFEAPVIEMPLFLQWLEDEVAAGGGSLQEQRFDSLAEVDADLIVNCSGLGARELVGDEDVSPVRGQVVVVENPGIETFHLDEHSPAGLTYIVPRSEDCVLGGTDEEGSWDTTPNPEVAAAILARCIDVEPLLKDARVIDHKVGLRPVRPTVRVEREVLDDGRACVHNYGHGGAGITLSWGCAEEVASLVEGITAIS